jgi:predicted HicB family RNase H-like nuclease
VGFHADTAENLKASFQEAVEDYIETRAKLSER